MNTNCPKCGSQDVCQDYISLRPVRTYGWVCDHCGHTWDVTTITAVTDTEGSREAIRLACQYRSEVNSGLSLATLKLQCAAGLLRDEDPLPFPAGSPVWFDHALSGLESALAASMALQDAIRAALRATERDRDKGKAGR